MVKMTIPIASYCICLAITTHIATFRIVAKMSVIGVTEHEQI